MLVRRSSDPFSRSTVQDPQFTIHAARPLILSSVLTCCTKLSCFTGER